jgi:hypothetical protein
MRQPQSAPRSDDEIQASTLRAARFRSHASGRHLCASADARAIAALTPHVRRTNARKHTRVHTRGYAQAGYGAEQLKDLLKVFFQELMGTLTDHGGDVLRLAGDALIAVFHDRTKH